jgi:GT2 family glycosyltransferase
MQVSVIIGSYRPGKCLYRCIKSLTKQTKFADEIVTVVESIQEDKKFQTEPYIPCKFVASGKTGVSSLDTHEFWRIAQGLENIILTFSRFSDNFSAIRHEN